jgi:hypothetical protein
MLFLGSSLLYKEGANKTLKINSFQPTLSQNMCLFDLKTIFGSFCEAKLRLNLNEANQNVNPIEF